VRPPLGSQAPSHGAGICLSVLPSIAEI
jgi:hypothetical protein